MEKGSGLLDAYPAAMKTFHNTYSAAGTIDEKTAYLFFFDQYGAGGAKNRDADGFMPRGQQFGYMFTKGFSNKTAMYTAAAHELGHGVFVLKHTFDNDYQIPNGSTDNLMDYADNATHIAKWQWDLMHDPGVVMRVFERDEDAMKIFQDNKCDAQRLLEKFRVGYTENKNMYFENSVITVSNIKFGNHIFSNIIVITRNETFNPRNAKERDMTVSKSRYKPELYTMIGFRHKPTSSNNDSWAFEVMVPHQDVNYMQEYLFTSDIDRNSEIDTRINTDRWETMLNEISCFPDEALEILTIRQRVDIITILADKSKLRENFLSSNANHELLAIRLIKTTTQEQINSLFAELQKNNLMEKLCRGIDNWGGEDNYTRFIAALTQLFISSHKDELNQITQSDKTWENYVNQQRKEGKNVHFVWQTTNYNYKYGVYANVWYKKEYKDNLIYFRSGTGHIFDIQEGKPVQYSYPALNPFDIVTVYFGTAPQFISSTIPKATLMAIPAFLFEWICNEYHNKQIVDYIDAGITVASCVVAVGNVGKGIKILSYLRLLAAAGDVALLNSGFSNYVMTSITDENEQEKILYIWGIFSKGMTFDGAMEDLWFKNYATASFGIFVSAWNGFKSTSEYQELKSTNADMIKAIEELLIMIEKED
jgi:hypothetical protein